MARDSSEEGGQGGGGEGQVKAWDFPTRAFHWTLVLLIASAYLTRHYGDDDLFWHKMNGYAVLILIVFRILWGFAGGSTSRFLAFASWPWTAALYLFDFMRGVPRKFLGHNPLGGWVVFAMLVAIGFQGFSGLFSNDDASAEGPLYIDRWADYDQSAEWTSLHLFTFDVILLLIVLHITANLVYLFWKKDNLIKPMVTGYKLAESYEDQPEAQFGSPLLALACLAAAAALVLGGIKLAGGTLF